MNAQLLKKLGGAAAIATLAIASGTAQATDVRGAGSSFVYPVMSKWAAAYAEKTGNQVNYQSIGSGAGIAQIKAGTIDFGASDIPLDDDELAKSGLIQFPDIIGGIVPVINVAGIQAGDLVLDGPTLAQIFLGRITHWNDPAILELNPGRTLPADAIIVVHRSDGSGTTFNFADYLAKVSPEWKDQVGVASAVAWPVGIGGKGNEGVSASVRQIANTIGYVEYAHARQNELAYTRMRNAAGNTVAPEAQSFQAAADTADWAAAPNFNLLMTNAPGAQAWPITAGSWVLMHKQPQNAQRSGVVRDFLNYAYADGKAAAAALDYVPLPDTLVGRIQGYWQQQFAQ